METMGILKKFLAFFLLAGFFSVANAQDIITQKNGDEIKVKVLEVGTSDVKYKKFGNDSGPVYTLQKSEIFMIKYENGEKDMFGDAAKTNTTSTGKTGSSSVQNASSSQNATQVRTQTQSQTQSQAKPQPQEQSLAVAREETTGSTLRRGYVGLNIGAAFVTESYDNVNSGVEWSFNFGYLFSKNVGIQSSIFGTSFNLSNYTNTSIGLVGFLAGPLFSTAPGESGKIELDLRPSLGFAYGSASMGNDSDISDEAAFAAGLGGTVRWNCSSRISLSGSFDYYYGKIDELDLSSAGIGVGVNFRF